MQPLTADQQIVVSDGAADVQHPRAVTVRVKAPRTVLILLGLVSVLSFVTRAAWIDNPKTLIFDENYYVNAARTIVGISPVPDAAYAGASLGLDPNGEHPPLAKLAIAAGIKLFGDGPMGWRAAPVLFGSLAIIALYWLVRAAGGGAWPALGAASILAADNLFLVHGRIATLDIFVVTMMLAGTALYLSERPVLAGIALGVGGCTKLIGLTVLGVLAVLEVIRRIGPGSTNDGGRDAVGPRLRAMGACVAATTVTFFGLLAYLDARFTSFTSPLAHLRYMVGYAGNLPAHPPAHPGVAFAPTSSPWEWLLNRKAILYYQHAAAGRPGHVLVQFQGRLSPFVIFLAVPALVAAARAAWRHGDPVARVALAWTATTFGAFVVVSLGHRFNYLYYMLAVLPGICMAIARVPSGRTWTRIVVPLYAMALVFALVAMFPFHSWGGA